MESPYSEYILYMMPNLPIKFHENLYGGLGVLVSRNVCSQADRGVSIYPQSLFLGGIKIQVYIGKL